MSEPGKRPDAEVFTHMALAKERFAAGDAETAVALAREAMERFPGHVVPYNDLADIYIQLREFALAEEMLACALALANPGHTPDIYRLYGFLFTEQGEVEKALEYLHRSLTMCRDGYTLYHLGRAYMRKGELEEALRLLREAAALLPEDARVRTLLKDLED